MTKLEIRRILKYIRESRNLREAHRIADIGLNMIRQEEMVPPPVKTVDANYKYTYAVDYTQYGMPDDSE